MHQQDSCTMRVRVLDSLVLDSELLRILQETISPVLNSFHLSRWTEEVQLLIKFLLWKYSVYDKGFSVGQNLLGLAYHSSTSNRRRNAQLTLFFALESLVPYVCKKLERSTISIVQPLYWKWMETVVKASQFLNLCIFLRNGHYPSLAHRLTQLVMISNPAIQQTPSADYSSSQTRQLVWHYFADFLTIVLPIIKLLRCRAYFMRLVKPQESLPQSVSTRSNKIGDDSSEDQPILCCYCKDVATIPTRIVCCSFCYYCIKSNPTLETDIVNGRNPCQRHSS